MVKRKEFILGALAGLTFAAAATAGGVIDWPSAQAGPVAGASGRLAPSAGAAGLAFAPPQGAPLSFADIIQQVAPAVVQIDVKTRVQGGQRFIQIPGLGAVPAPNGEGEDAEGATARGAGSGFFISADGFIVTNNHVVADAVEIKVKLADGRELDGRVIGRDESTDLAVIKVDGRDFPFVTFEEAAQPRVGDWVIAVGNPFGLGGTATAGIVSAQARNIPDEAGQYVDFLQIDAAINTGNSGGPTFDIYGRVIGVNSAIFTPSGGSVGIGFAIPASIAKPITDQLMRGEAIERGYLGVGIQTLSNEQREALGLADTVKGALVGEVTPGGPSERAGLQVEDIVLSINGEAVETSTELTRKVANAQAGQTLRLEVLREGRRMTVNVVAGRRPPTSELRAGQGAEPEAAPESPVAGQVVEGLTVAPLTSALRSQYDLPANLQGLVVTAVAPRSQAAQLGIPAGVVIVRANNRQVTTVADFRAAIDAVRAAGRPGVLLLVRVQGTNRSVVLPLAKAE